jgi:D-tyrosyl-tRNA(Tyr) deacylase
MRVLLQRCSRASVTVDGEVVGRIGQGLVALVGTTHGDDLAIARELARRVAGYRVFPDADGRTNRSVIDVGGAVLVVPQFTLYANTKKGTRPSFVRADEPARTRRAVNHTSAGASQEGMVTAPGDVATISIGSSPSM